jgi:poly(ADP-ribose) glycohydrolase
MCYSLSPSSPAFKGLARFSIAPDLETEEDAAGRVPFWPVLESLLASPISTPSQPDTIAVILRDTFGPAGDYGLLKTFITANADAFFNTCWPAVVELARELTSLFPQGTASSASRHHYSMLHIIAEADCVSECAPVPLYFRAPAWRDESYDFSIWYTSHQANLSVYKIHSIVNFGYFNINWVKFRRIRSAIRAICCRIIFLFSAILL